MGLVLSPVVKMARRVINKHSLQVPFDLYSLVNEYAEIIYKNIPIDGVDGICLHLKTAGKTPKIILNTNSSQVRMNFTLAHELGHIIIPWHYGIIVDEVNEEIGNFNSAYWEIEREANRFASELLMPFEWIFSLYNKNPSSDYLISQICNKCHVSEMAARIRLGHAINEIEYILMPLELILENFNKTGNLAETQAKLVEITKFPPKRVAEIMVRDFPKKIAFCVERKNKVVGTGGSQGTHPFYQFEGDDFVNSPYTYFESYSISRIGDIRTHWWSFDRKFNIKDDDRNWKDILNEIAQEVAPGEEKRFKLTFNGKISGAHGIWLQKKRGDISKFIEDVISRFDSPDFREFSQHPHFLVLIKKRCEALYSKR